MKHITTLSLITWILFTTSGCSVTQELHNKLADPNVISWEREFSNENLLVQTQWAKPMQPGPHPTLIIHPGLNETSSDLTGLTIDLANHGYLAVAVSYERKINGSLTTTPFSLRELEDINFVISTITQNPLVDKANIGAIGFSLGGANTFLLAANSNNIKAVATYYPMSDIIDWVDNVEKPFIWQLASMFMKSNVEKEFPNTTIEQRRKILVDYSAINYTDKLDMPILIFHGTDDAISPLYHSHSLVEKLRTSGNSNANLKVVENAGHAFNFRSTQQARSSWDDLLIWLNLHMRS